MTAYVPAGVTLTLDMGSGPSPFLATSLSVTSPQGEVADVTGIHTPTKGSRDLVATGDVTAAGSIVVEALRPSGSTSWATETGKSGVLAISSIGGEIPSDSWNVFLVSVVDNYNLGRLVTQTLTFQIEEA